MADEIHDTASSLPIDAVARCTRVRVVSSALFLIDMTVDQVDQEAQKDGIFAGLSSGLVGGQC